MERSAGLLKPRMTISRLFLIHYGRTLMADYVRAVEAISEEPLSRSAIAVAERIAPSLVRCRRRARACARLARRFA